ncbi:MAG: NAD(P)-dependent oxidoreductase [Gammaproteobacteria bacterium]|nr:NAD(P)-dependent oxidoreductase [Gammaproteobacteria bacterium]
MKISMIGLGKMGSALARRLMLAKFDLIVYNRTASKMTPFVEAGIACANSLQEAVENRDIVITSLLDDQAVLQTVDGFVNFLKPGAIHLGTSTILPDTSKQLLDMHHQKNSIYVVGNVLGVPKAADRGELTSVVAGEEKAVDQCQPIFSAYSTKTLVVGDVPYQANVVKVCMNYMLISAIETMGELYAFAEKSDLDANIIHAWFHSVYAHPAFKLYVDKIKDRDFDNVNFDLKGGNKDVTLFQKALSDVGIVPDIANVIKNKFTIAKVNGLAEKDWSAITEVTRLLANM